MAMVTRFQDPDYVNWVKAGQALLCTAEGMYTFCEDPIKRYHLDLHRKFPRQPCSGPCRVVALCNVCAKRRDEWKKDIISQLTPRTNACWVNTDKSKWETDAWEIAKVFMGPGQGAFRAGAADTDPIGLLQLALNCQLFTSCISNRQSFDNVKTIRNKMFHSANLKLTNTEMKDHIKAMTTLLQDPAQLSNDSNAKAAVRQLQQIEALPLEANDSRVIQSERTLWTQKIEWISNQQSVAKEEVEEIMNYVTAVFGRETYRVRTLVDSLERRTTKSEEVQQQHGHDLSRQQEHHRLLEEQQIKQTEELSKQKVSQRQLKEQQIKQSEDISQLQQQQQHVTEALHQQIEEVQQQHGHDRSQQQEHQRLLEEQQTKQGEKISQLRQQQQDVPDKEIKDKLKKELGKMYSRLTVPVQDTVSADCCNEVPLNKMFVELRLQKSSTTQLPETLSYRDVEEMQQCMQSSEPIQTSQLFDELHHRCAPRKVLMLGKAGIGKTTLIKQVASQWAKKEIWKHIEYLFVITLRQLRQDRKLTLGDLLLDGLSLTKEEKTAALNHLRENASTVMIVTEGWDEIKYTDEEGTERDDTKEVELNTILSSILENIMMPGAKVLITSRPNNNVPVCDRSAELYGFTQESIDKYINTFCRQDTELEQFIKRYLENNVNIATMCYVPVQTNFVCACLKDMHSSSHSEDTPPATMTQLYVFAAVNIAKKLHPSLKGNKTDIDEKKFCEVVGDSLKNHAKLAKYCTMSTPLRIIMYEEDLDRFHISDKDKNTGYLAQSLRGNQSPCLKRRCWIFHHLTIQEMFCALGLLRGPRKALLKLIKDETSVGQREVLIMFVVGLLCDPRNARFMEYLESANDRPRTFKKKVTGVFKTLKLAISKHHLNPRTFIKKLARVFDPLQLTTAIHESQCPELTDLVPREIESNNVFPTEMMALSWTLRQPLCRVTSLNVSKSQLDNHLVKQLCAGLTGHTSLKSLNLRGCNIPAEGMVALAAAIETLTALTELKLERCHIADSGARQIVAAAVDLPNLRNLNLVDNHISPDVEGQLEEETRERTQLWWETYRSEGLCVGLFVQRSPPVALMGCDRLGCVPWSYEV